MAYIGKSPTGTGVRSRFYYTQTSGGGTSISGTDDSNKTLTFTDGEYIDVYLNGVLLVAGTDYNTNTANTISGLAALANGDVVEVVVYDVFTVADTVSASQGGTFNAGVTMSDGLTVDDDGAAPLTVDRASSDGDAIIIQKDGTQTGAITTNGDDTVEIYGEGSAKTGLRFGGSSLIPLKNAGALSDNGVDLGTSSYRFNDAYLGGNLYIGGTGSANALDDYEEGTFTANFDFSTSASGGMTWTQQGGRYIKVGSLVFISAFLSWSANGFTASSGSLRLVGLPFTSSGTNAYRGGFYISYASNPFTGLSNAYAGYFRTEQSSTQATFNFFNNTGTLTMNEVSSHTNIGSSGNFMVTGSYTVV